MTNSTVEWIAEGNSLLDLFQMNEQEQVNEKIKADFYLKLDKQLKTEIRKEKQRQSGLKSSFRI